MAAFGWAELTGASSSTSHRPPTASSMGSKRSQPDDDTKDGSSSPARLPRIETDVPPSDATENVNADELTTSSPAASQFLTGHPPDERARSSNGRLQSSPEQEQPTRSYTLPNNPVTDFINLFKPGPGKAHPSHPQRMTKKIAKTYHRAQTIKHGEAEPDDPHGGTQSDDAKPSRPRVSRGDTIEHDPSRMPPPKTSIFDAASDILNPPLPSQSWLLDPTKRERTIFHDRIYHPEDIPPPPSKRPRLSRSFSSSSAMSTRSQQETSDALDDGSGMRVEEKIARAYHADMSWRKVLVRLEPDAHNNMIVRRIFANAHGWDVVKHVCDTHFAPTYAAQTRDEDEGGNDRALPLHKPVTKSGEEVEGQTSMEPIAPLRDRTFSENAEARDEVSDLQKPIAATGSMSSRLGSSKAASKIQHQDSAEWSDSAFNDSDDDEDDEEERIGPFETFQRFWQGSPKPEKQRTSRHWPSRVQPQLAEQMTREPATLEAHRGLDVAGPPPFSTATHPTVDADTIEPLMAGDAQPEFLADLEPVEGPGGATDIGLRKPPAAHVDGLSANTGSDHAGVAEQVARLSMSSKSEGK